jgi:hypothetical protein
LEYLTSNKTEAALLATRFSTVLFALLYIIPFAGGPSCFRKALIANAATSALRLHQRLPGVTLSRAFLGQLVAEDSAHYLLFSVIFLYSSPITLVLLPIALFAFLHLSSNALVLMDKTGTRASKLGNLLAYVVQNYQKTILLTVAMSEIILMPITVLAVLTGLTSLVTPFIYYRFLSFRYASRRNPYTRQTFRQVRLSVEQIIFLPACPQIVRTIGQKAIELTCRLAPTMVPAN